MRIVKPEVEIITPINGDDILKHIEKVGRVCYKSELNITDESADKFVLGIIKRGHEAVIEHFNITVKFTTDRGISHEIVRHRIASYAQESTRYVSYGNRNIKIDNEENVLDAYEAGLSMKKIANRSNNKYTELDIYKILESYDIKKRNIGNRGIVNENYFEVINTPEKAYFLGFIESDGSLRRNLSQLTISQKEEEQWWILNMIRDFIQPEAKTLNIHNYKLCNDLYKNGIIPNKTYENNKDNIEILWNSIPFEFKYDFIRGMLDGDGNIKWFYQDKSSKTMSCNIGFTGNKYLLLKIQELLKQDFDYDLKLYDYNTYSRIYITDSKVGKLFCEKMYKNFKFPYGHSKTARYFEAFNLEIPYKYDECKLKDFNVVIPQYKINGKKDGLNGKELWVWGDAILKAEITYKDMLDLGVTPQVARSVLPTCTKTEIMVTMNLREWRYFIKLRSSKTAHPDIRILAIDLLNQFKECVPVIFDDIKVEE